MTSTTPQPAGSARHVLYSLAFGIAFGLTGRTVPAATSYVTPQGSPAPEVDDPLLAWQSIESAALALPEDGGTIVISPGAYRERLFLNAPVTLTAPAGGVVIGNLASGVVATTTFNVWTWNTHLAGDEVFMASWLDYERAAEMGAKFAARRQTIDLVALCEVWDEDLLFGGDGAAGIGPLSGYLHSMHGTRVDNQSEGCSLLPRGIPPTVLNSGLAMMSDHSLSDPIQVSFTDCDGSCPTDGSPDCLASKGFIAATVVKDGFTFRVYNTHTQSGNGDDAIEARQHQIEQMAAHINAYRNDNPSHVVLLMGDLNVIGESPDQYSFLRDRFGGIGGRDAARNAAVQFMYKQHAVAHTLTSFNELAIHFDITPYDQRLDYVWYFPSLDGTVRIHPAHVERILDESRGSMKGGFTGTKPLVSDELSDHYPLRANFVLYRSL